MSKKYTAAPANVVEHTDRNISGTLTGAANITRQAIPAPGLNRRLVVTSFILVNENAQLGALLTLMSGNQQHWLAYIPAASSFSKDFPANHPWKIGENTALNIRASAAVIHDFSFQYHIEAY